MDMVLLVMFRWLADVYTKRGARESRRSRGRPHTHVHVGGQLRMLEFVNVLVAD